MSDMFSVTTVISYLPLHTQRLSDFHHLTLEGISEKTVLRVSGGPGADVVVVGGPMPKRFVPFVRNGADPLVSLVVGGFRRTHDLLVKGQCF